MTAWYEFTNNYSIRETCDDDEDDEHDDDDDHGKGL